MMLGAQGPCSPSTTKADLNAGSNGERTLGLISAHRQTEGPVERRQAPTCVFHTSKARPHAEIVVVYPQELF